MHLVYLSASKKICIDKVKVCTLVILVHGIEHVCPVSVNMVFKLTFVGEYVGF